MSGSTRRGLQLLIGAWYVAGAVLLIALLAKGDVEDLSSRAGGAALAIVVLGFPILAGVRLAERPDRLGLVGVVTFLVSTATLVLAAVEIWRADWLEHYERTIVMVVLSLLLGTISLLFEGERDEDDGPVRLARGIAALALFALGVMAILETADVSISSRLAGIAAALFVIPVLSLPALRLLSNER